MSLFSATLIFGLFSLTLGSFLILGPRGWEIGLKAFGRSKFMANLVFGAALAWFMWEVAQLGEIDFGAYRPLLFILFGGAGLLSFYYIPDFLSVRGLAGLGLLAAQPLLAAAYCQPYASRLALVCGVYGIILFSFYLGAYPYRFRDFVQWIYAFKRRAHILGVLLTGYGLGLIGIAFNY